MTCLRSLGKSGAVLEWPGPVAPGLACFPHQPPALDGTNVTWWKCSHALLPQNLTISQSHCTSHKGNFTSQAGRVLSNTECRAGRGHEGLSLLHRPIFVKCRQHHHLPSIQPRTKGREGGGRRLTKAWGCRSRGDGQDDVLCWESTLAPLVYHKYFGGTLRYSDAYSETAKHSYL